MTTIFGGTASELRLRCCSVQSDVNQSTNNTLDPKKGTDKSGKSPSFVTSDRASNVAGSKGSEGNIIDSYFEPTHSRQSLWLVLAALWLQAIVVIFVIVKFTRLQTAVGDWTNKAIDLIK